MKEKTYNQFVKNLIPSEDKKVVWLFFLTFSRFEYALKRTPPFARIGRSKNAEADWDKFAKDCNDSFCPTSDCDLQLAYDFFCSNPPKKQILIGDKLGFEDAPPKLNGLSLQELLCMVRRVRNNLFHGGKFPMRYVEDPARNPALIKHALTILKACLSFNPHVEEKFFGDV
jgi:hypothetical protein